MELISIFDVFIVLALPACRASVTAFFVRFRGSLWRRSRDICYLHMNVWDLQIITRASDNAVSLLPSALFFKWWHRPLAPGWVFSWAIIVVERSRRQGFFSLLLSLSLSRSLLISFFLLWLLFLQIKLLDSWPPTGNILIKQCNGANNVCEQWSKNFMSPVYHS